MYGGNQAMLSELEYTQKGKEKEYKFTIPNIAPKTFADEMVIEVFDKDNNSIQTINTSVKQELMEVMNSISADAKEQALAKDLLNLGAESQLLFNYNTENLANAELSAEEKDLSDVTLATLTPYKTVISGETEGATALGNALNVSDAGYKYKMYFTIVGDIANYEVKCEETILTPVSAGNYDSKPMYYFVLPNVYSLTQLKDMHTVVVKNNGSGDLSVSISLLTYAYTALKEEEKNGSDDAANWSRALYKASESAYALSD